tara:strand:- start:11336 stop:12421 length:1086 start_codon:yes stop_codon:yes gene_type:complete
MIGQHLYFLNNKKYITNITNLETVIFEINSFYHTKNPRTIVCVHPSREDNILLPGDIQVRADALRSGIGEQIVFKQWEEITEDYIQNSEKCILVFWEEEDQIAIHARYVSGLLTAAGFYSDTDYDVNDIAAQFLEKVISCDSMFTYMSASPVVADISDYANGILTNEATPPYNVVYQNGKNFSYDLLFYLNDYYPCAAVQSLLIEKFTIHSADMAQDVMEHFTSRRHYLAYILSVIDWMNANDLPVDKQAFINDTYLKAANNGNYQVAFYKLEELWNRVKGNAAFIQVHADKRDASPDGWEFWDLYTEINNVFPIVKKVLERTFDMDNLTEDLRLINTDVQFFSKRQNRIPYLIHKYTLTD